MFLASKIKIIKTVIICLCIFVENSHLAPEPPKIGFELTDFCNKSSGIFVLFFSLFFSSDNFDFLTSHFWRDFFMSFKNYCCLELKFEKIFYLWSFSQSYMGLKIANLEQLTREKFRASNAEAEI